MLKKIVLIFAAIVSLYSCIPEPLPLKVPQAESKVVVFSQVIPNRFMIVSLTRSFSALDYNGKTDTIGQDFVNSLLEKGARVTISYDNRVDTLFEAGMGIYISLNTLQITGQTYRLNIVTNKGEVISSETNILDKVNFDSLQPKIVKVLDDTIVNLRVRFKDIPGRNWYMINYYQKGYGRGIDFNDYFNNGSNILTQTVLLSDLELENGIYDKIVPLEGVRATDSISVSLSNISEAYYLFLNQRNKSGNLTQQIFNEPINYISNVKNGYGFFNAHYPDIYFFDLKDY